MIVFLDFFTKIKCSISTYEFNKFEILYDSQMLKEFERMHPKGNMRKNVITDKLRLTRTNFQSALFRLSNHFPLSWITFQAAMTCLSSVRVTPTTNLSINISLTTSDSTTQWNQGQATKTGWVGHKPKRTVGVQQS